MRQFLRRGHLGRFIGCLFATLGGFLATRLPSFFHWQLQSLFLFSSIMRLGFFTLLFGKFHEYHQALPKRAEDIYLELPGFRMGAGLVRNVFRKYRPSAWEKQ